MRSVPNAFPSPRPLQPGRRTREPEPSTLALLDDETLLALLLGRSVAAPDTERIAAALIGRFGGLGDLVAADVPELGRIEGLGPTAILDLKLLRELSVRLSRSSACARPVLSSWNALVAYARTTLAHLPREQFRVLFLDRRNILLRDEHVADDPTVQAAVDRRIEHLLDATAARIVAGRSDRPADVASEGRSFDPSN